MAMNVGAAEDGDDPVIGTINTTPLVDVMLVLLIIFLITVPAVTSSIPVALPKERVEQRETKPDHIVLSVDRTGGLYWHDTRLASTEALVDRLKAVAARPSQPEVQIRGDMAARYEGVGRILLACQRAGIVKVTFVTEPPARG